MDYFREAIGIGILYCLGLLWAIDLVGKPHWHPKAHINCCIDVSLCS